MTRTLELGWGCVDVVREYIPQDQDTDAALFAGYLAADSHASRAAIATDLAARGYLTTAAS
jgi:hypothetical protein